MKRLLPLAIKDVIPYVLPAPVGIDMAVSTLQASFAEHLPWLEKAFARAVIRSEKREDKNYIFPAMFVETGYDFLDMLQLDNFESYSFFVAHDPETALNYQQYLRSNTFQRRLSAIFWMDLESINPARGDDFLEELKEDIKTVIKQTTFATYSNNRQVDKLSILNIYDEPKAIFEGFTMPLEMNHFLYYPYRGLRVEMEVEYVEGC